MRSINPLFTYFTYLLVVVLVVLAVEAGVFERSQLSGDSETASDRVLGQWRLK